MIHVTVYISPKQGGREERDAEGEVEELEQKSR